MHKKLSLILMFILLGKIGFTQVEQTLVTKKQNKQLETLFSDFSVKKAANRERAFALAKENKWPVFRIQKDGAIISLQGVDDLGYPLYLKTYNNTDAAATTKTNSLYNGGSLGVSINGSASNLIGKVGIWDGGGILLNHQEFAPNRIEQKDKPASVSLHSTHVAGTMMAKGINPLARGMAWGLQKLYAWDYDNDAAEMTQAASAGMLISNHSYGYIAGWDYNSDSNPPRWEYYGVPGSKEDYKFGFYDDTARDWDKICFNAPFYLPVASAGNSRTLNGPAVGDEYYGYESSSSSKFVSKGARPGGISSNDGYDIIASTANAKNILTVGAVYPLPYGASKPSDIRIASFSSWGPTDDGRVKPDLVADGVNVTSTSSDDTKSYTSLSGTSMAAPNASGSMVLLQEYYTTLNGGSFMKAATLKGLLINSADEAGTTTGPDYIYGWGLLNVENAANTIKVKGSKSIISERTLSQGEVYTLQIIASGQGVLKATLCWTDPQGSVKPDGTLNDRTPKLVNDLDLRITKGTDEFLPYKLDPLNPSAPAISADNTVDNVEQIYIANATPGEVYSLSVKHKGILSGGLQNYALIVSGVGGKVYCSSAPTAADGAVIENVAFASLNNTPPAACRTYSNFTQQSTDLEQGKSYPFSIKVGSCGLNADKIVAIFADWNNDGDFDDEMEMVGKSVVYSANGTFTGNLNVPTSVVPGNYTLLRIVVKETSNAADVSSCGAYAKGETQDYRLRFIKSSTDAGVISIKDELSNLCEVADQTFTVRLRNFGSATLTNIPVTLNLSSNSTIIKTVTENYSGSLLPNAEVDFTLSTTFNLQPNKNYQIDAKTDLVGDLIIGNNSSTKTFATASPQNPSDLGVFACDNAAGYYQLNGLGDGTLFWYRSVSESLPFQIGNKTFTDKQPIGNSFFVGLNDFSGYFGAKNKKVYSGGNYSNNFGPKPIISVAAPMVLDSALLYISQSGKLTFTVETPNGAVLSSKTINVERTKTTTDVETAANLIADDLNDPGRMYKIGLEFPAAGTYYIGIDFADGATIFRSNVGVNNIPITLGPDLIKLTGAFSDSNGTIVNAYYYFYNMLFKSLGCASPNRVAVEVGKPMITQSGTILTASFADNYQWYFNKVLIAGATAKTYNATASGIYQVEAISSSGCTTKSAEFNYVLSGVSPANPQEIDLKIFPVPAAELLNVSFDIPKKENIEISLSNIFGQSVFQRNWVGIFGKFATTINVKDYSPGSYILTITVGKKVYSQKITIAH